MVILYIRVLIKVCDVLSLQTHAERRNMEYIMRHSYKVVNLRYIIRFAAEHVRNSGNHYCRRGRGGRYLEGHGKFFDYYKANLYSNNILSKFDIYKFA